MGMYSALSAVLLSLFITLSRGHSVIRDAEPSDVFLKVSRTLGGRRSPLHSQFVVKNAARHIKLEARAASSSIVGTQIILYSKTNYLGGFVDTRAPIPNRYACIDLPSGLRGSVYSLKIKWNVKDSIPNHLVCGQVFLWTEPGCYSTGYILEIPGGFNNVFINKYDYAETDISDSTRTSSAQSISRAAPPVQTTRSPPPSPPLETGGNADCLNPHNAARAALNVGMQRYTWSSSIAARAQSWANTLASQGCSLAHGDISNVGQNLYVSSNLTATCADASSSWISEKEYFSYNTYASCCTGGKQCGHYTQVIWNTSTLLGCGSAVCNSSSGGGIIWACDYSAPGNYIGQYPC